MVHPLPEQLAELLAEMERLPANRALAPGLEDTLARLGERSLQAGHQAIAAAQAEVVSVTSMKLAFPAPVSTMQVSLKAYACDQSELSTLEEARSVASSRLASAELELGRALNRLELRIRTMTAAAMPLETLSSWLVRARDARVPRAAGPILHNRHELITGLLHLIQVQTAGTRELVQTLEKAAGQLEELQAALRQLPRS